MGHHEEKFNLQFENQVIFQWILWYNILFKIPTWNSLTFAPFQNFPDICSNSLTIPWPWKNKFFPDFSLTRGNPVMKYIYIYILQLKSTIPTGVCIFSRENQVFMLFHIHMIHELNMMTSWNGNIFRVTGPLCEEFTGYQWISSTQVSDSHLSPPGAL